MSVEVLVSTMYQNDFSLVEKMNIRSDGLYINQTNENNYEERIVNKNIIRYLSNGERGLSCSRNKAIEMATGDICVIADDDVRYNDDYCQIIEKAYQDYPDADIIAFVVRSTNQLRPKVYKNKLGKQGFIGLLRIASFEITFKWASIVAKGITFNTKFGAGSLYAGVGEESIFLQECRKKGLIIYFVPKEIGVVTHEESSWFSGYSETYFFHKGIASRIIMGIFGGMLFCCYFAIFKYPMYHKDLSITKALISMFKGLATQID